MTKKKLATDKPRSRNAVNEVPEGLFGIELDARRTGRLQTATLLRDARTPLTVIAVADNAAALAEQTLADVRETFRPPTLACQEGCDWCCHLTVGTSVPEVARIIAYLRRTLSPEQFEALRERVIVQDNARREAKAARRNSLRQPCPLLVEHRCVAYPVRPLTCRGCNSTSAHQCELFLDPRNKAVVPMYVPQHRLTTFVLDGMRAGLTEAGLKGDLLELAAALRIALETPDALERWLTGAAMFDAARSD